MSKIQLVAILLVLQITYASVEPINLAPTIQTNPCTSQSFCGLATNFLNTAELTNFASSKCPAIVDCIEHSGGQTNPPQTNDTRAEIYGNEILKKDGDYIYTVSGAVLSIVRVTPSGRTQIMSKTQLTGTVNELFLDGNMMTILTTETVNQEVSTWLKIYDVQQKNAIRFRKSIKNLGKYVEATKTDTGFVYLITQTSCLYQNSFPWYQKYETQGVSNKIEIGLRQIFYYKKTDYNLAGYLNIFVVNMRNPSQNSQNMISVVTPSFSELYLSGQNIYLVCNEIISDKQVTQIHKINLSGSRIVPMADAIVQGTIQDRSFLNEFNGILRLVTFKTDEKRGLANYVYCLNANLKVVGRLERFAFNTKIEKVFYTQNRLYLATTKPANPFFVVDLRNHRNPYSLGQLKILGYSNFVQPYDDNTIIVFGRTVIPFQTPTIKVALFDVKIVTQARKLAQYILEPFYSSNYQVNWNHKGFNFFSEKNLLVIPANYYTMVQNRLSGTSAFNGALVFEVRKAIPRSTIQLKGMINHLMTSDDEYGKKYIQQSLIIGDLLYTKTKCLMRVHNLPLLTAAINVELNCETDPSANLKTVAVPDLTPDVPLNGI